MVHNGDNESSDKWRVGQYNPVTAPNVPRKNRLRWDSSECMPQSDRCYFIPIPYQCYCLTKGNNIGRQLWRCWLRRSPIFIMSVRLHVRRHVGTQYRYGDPTTAHRGLILSCVNQLTLVPLWSTARICAGGPAVETRQETLLAFNAASLG